MQHRELTYTMQHLVHLGVHTTRNMRGQVSTNPKQSNTRLGFNKGRFLCVLTSAPEQNTRHLLHTTCCYKTALGTGPDTHPEARILSTNDPMHSTEQACS